MNRLLKLIVVVLIICFSLNARAGDFNYSYADIGLMLVDNDGTDAAGIAGQFSHAVNDEFRLRLGASYTEGLDVDVWIENLFITAGYIMEIDSDKDIVVDVGFVTDWFENNFTDDSDTSVYLTGTLRIETDNDIELFLGGTYESLYDDSELGLNAGLIFSTDSDTSFGVRIFIADVSVAMAFMRLYSD